MEYARVVNDVVIEVVDKDPAGLYHPDFLVALPFIEVPDGTEVGATLVEDTWVNPTPPPPPPPPPAPPAPTITVQDFWRLWSMPEWLDAVALGEKIPEIELLLTRLDDPRVKTVELAAYEFEITWLVNMMETIPVEQKGARLGQILTGTPV
jgi:hypothetical protein